jgi:seryl-tRNA synthetase
LNYTGATLETNNAAKAAEILIAEKSYISDKAKELDKKQVQAMLELEGARDLVEALKDDLQQAKDKGTKTSVLKDIKEEIKQAEKARDQEKKELTQARDKYDDYMANRAKDEPVKVAVTKEKPAESKQNNADNQPKAAPAPQVIAIQSAPKVSASSGGSSGGGGGGKRK